MERFLSTGCVVPFCRLDDVLFFVFSAVATAAFLDSFDFDDIFLELVLVGAGAPF